jgi:hypothetical protein
MRKLRFLQLSRTEFLFFNNEKAVSAQSYGPQKWMIANRLLLTPPV